MASSPFDGGGNPLPWLKPSRQAEPTPAPEATDDAQAVNGTADVDARELTETRPYAAPAEPIDTTEIPPAAAPAVPEPEAEEIPADMPSDQTEAPETSEYPIPLPPVPTAEAIAEAAPKKRGRRPRKTAEPLNEQTTLPITASDDLSSVQAEQPTLIQPSAVEEAIEATPRSAVTEPQPQAIQPEPPASVMAVPDEMPAGSTGLADHDRPAEVTEAAERPIFPPGAADELPPPQPTPEISTTSARLRLSDILKEAEKQRRVPLAPPIFPQAAEPSIPPVIPDAEEMAARDEYFEAPPAASPTQPRPSRPAPAVSPDEYPSLLERPRDGKTEPYLDLMPEAMADEVDQNFKELDRLPAAADPALARTAAPYVAPPPARERRFQPDTAGRVPWKVLNVILLGIALAGFIGALSGWVLTREESASDVNRRIAAQLTEVDRYLANNLQAIREAEPDDGGRVALPGYPLPITLSAEEAAELGSDELRDVILDRAADLTYATGVEAYGPSSGLLDDLSTPGLVRFGIEVMQESAHDRFLQLTAVFGGVSVFLAAALLLLTRRSGRLSGLGAAMILGGVIAVAGSLLIRFVFDRATSSEDDTLSDGLGDIAADISFLFLRNSLVFLVVGVIVVALGFALSRFDRRQLEEIDTLEREPAVTA